MNRFVTYYLPVILWATLIFVLSSIPNLCPPRLGFRVEDKVAHMIEFGFLGYLVTRALEQQWSGNRWRTIFAALFFCALYAVSDEVHQLRVSGRFAEVSDAVADVLGVLVAQVIFFQKRSLVVLVQSVIGSRRKPQ